MAIKDTIMTDLTGKAGFGSPITEKTFAKRRRLGVEIFATLALAASLMIAVTAVSIGVARAQANFTVQHGSATPASVSTFLKTMMAGKIH
jgi:hypothetical protein